MLDWLKCEQEKNSEMSQETTDSVCNIHNNFKENFSKCCKNMQVLSSSALLENELTKRDILKKHAFSNNFREVNKSQLKDDLTESSMSIYSTRSHIEPNGNLKASSSKSSLSYAKTVASKKKN